MSAQIIAPPPTAQVIAPPSGVGLIVSQIGAPGIGSPAAVALLVGVDWGTPSSESGNAIEVGATIKNVNGQSLNTSTLDVQIVVTDGATDSEPSATATLTATSTPSGTVLGGSGTATLTIRSVDGAFGVKVNETSAGHRYLWLRGSGHCRLWPRSNSGEIGRAHV